MRIHTAASPVQVADALQKSGAYARVFSEHTSRSALRAYEVQLGGSSRRRPNSGRSGPTDNGYAATWDQWGIFLAGVFEADPNTKCWAYDGADAFHRITDERFLDGPPADAHGDHTFRYSNIDGCQTCTKCSAKLRH